MRPSALVLIAAALLCGCARTGMSSADRPALTLPARFQFAPPETGDNNLSAEALIPAGDPAFRALLARAASAPDLKAAIARIDAARAGAARARAERAPSIDLSASASQTRSNPQQFGNLPPGSAVDSTRFSVGGEIAARWDIDLFGRLRASERAAQRRLDAAGFDAEAVRLALASEIAAAIIDWKAVKAQKSQTSANIRAAEERARLINVRVRAGLNPGLDALRADALLQGLRAQLSPLEADEARIVGQMVTLTATAADVVLADLGRVDAESHDMQSAALPASVPSALTASRPDVQSAAAELAARDADVAAAAARRYPQFSLSSALGLLAFSLGGLFDTDAVTGRFGGTIATPLLDFGRIEADIDLNKARSREGFQLLRKAVFTALGECETAFGRAINADAEASQLRQQGVREARIATATASRNRAGLVSFIDVLDADRASYQAQIAAIAARARAERARLSLWQSLGGPGRASLFKGL